MPTSIIDRLLASDDLPTLPTVAVEVLKLTKSGDATADKLAAIVQRDPVITAKILKLINSSLYAMPRQITSVKQAISLIGLRSVTVTLLSLALVEAVKPRDAAGDADFDLDRFWRRSLTTATAARALAKARLPQHAEDAFIAGLLCDLGVLAAWHTARDEYRAVLSRARTDSRPVFQIEKDLLGATHAEFGGALLKSWQLPDMLCDCVGAHHSDGPLNVTESTRPLAAIVRAAARIAAVFAKDVPASALADARAECTEGLGVDEAALDELLATLETGVRDAARIMGLSVGQGVNLAALQAEAAMAMATLTMQAETDRTEAARRADAAQRDAARLSEERARILHVASTDALTGIANRAAFDARLGEEFSAARTSAGQLSLVMLDVDHFKKFNDTHGHQAGDEVLRTVAKAMTEAVGSRGMVARYGGEEFAIILSGEHGKIDAAARIAEQVRRTVEDRAVPFNGQSLHVTASFGVASVREVEPGKEPPRLIEVADRLLYGAKKAGRNRVMTSSMVARAAA